ncbi:MAG: hypothetical protein EYC70_12240 [Planctomycetota bacterium]|nr:MAG: hypothetical protein EYC70_12240 [Planctomycetota bacterium]
MATESAPGGLRGAGRAVIAVALAVSACRGELEPHLGAGVAAPDPEVLLAAGARFELQLGDEPFALARAEIEDWIRDAALAVASYYGRFPVARTTVRVRRVQGDGVGGGNTRAWDGSALIQVELGEHASVEDLKEDWVLPHEMVHLALPGLPRQHHWLEEGIATYVEPVARAQLGQLRVEEVWRQLVQGLPQGQPEPGDRGLDRTPTWGRTYWGGALFCLLADVGIRERTGNRFGLRDALRAVVAGGHTMLSTSTMEELLALCDEAAGVPVMSELYAAHATEAVTVDLDLLWSRLGVSLRGRRIRFDDAAPLAAVRRAITAGE